MVASLLGNVLFVPLSAILILLWAQASGTLWRDRGFGRPRRRGITIASGLVVGVLPKLARNSSVMPLLGAPSVNQAYSYLQGNTGALPGILFLVIAGAGFGEETLFRSYAFERLRRLVGTSAAATILTVVVTSAWFGAVHYPFQ